jgi:hypothetical protein
VPGEAVAELAIGHIGGLLAEGSCERVAKRKPRKIGSDL